MMTLYSHSIDCDPNDYIALTSMVSILDQKGRLPQAVEYSARAVNAKPDYAVSRDNYSWVLIKSGRYDEGIEQANMALKIRPDDPLAPASLALGYYFKGDHAMVQHRYTEAQDWYRKSWKMVHVAKDRTYSHAAVLRRCSQFKDARSGVGKCWSTARPNVVFGCLHAAEARSAGPAKLPKTASVVYNGLALGQRTSEAARSCARQVVLYWTYPAG